MASPREFRRPPGLLFFTQSRTIDSCVAASASPREHNR
jgi:hypothetical protein